MIDPLIRKLRTHEALSGADEAALGQAPWQLRDVARDGDVVVEGAQPTTVTLLVEGFACRYRLLASGKRQIIAFHVAGELLDLNAFLLGAMDHSVAALNHAKVASLPYPVLDELIAAHPRLGRALWREMAIEGAVFREWMVGLGRRSAPGRIAHLFCEMLLKLHAAGLIDDHRCRLPFTQSDLGDALGLSSVHINRVLQGLRRSGLISLRGSELVVTDWKRLKALGDFQPGYLHAGAAPMEELDRPGPSGGGPAVRGKRPARL